MFSAVLENIKGKAVLIDDQYLFDKKSNVFMTKGRVVALTEPIM